MYIDDVMQTVFYLALSDSFNDNVTLIYNYEYQKAFMTF